MIPRRTAMALGALVALFAVVLVVAQLVAPPSNSVGSPSHSRLRLVEDVFPPRRLTVTEIKRGGPTCLEGHTLVVKPGGGCTFIIPDGVHLVLFRRVAGSPGMTVTVSQTSDLTQDIDTAQPGPDPRDPLALRVADVHDGTTVTLFGCHGPAACRLDVDS